jgi:hypothetical protein
MIRSKAPRLISLYLQTQTQVTRAALQQLSRHLIGSASLISMLTQRKSLLLKSTFVLRHIHLSLFHQPQSQFLCRFHAEWEFVDF